MVSAVGLPVNGRRSAATPSGMDDELEVGQEAFNELKAKGEIVAATPLYDQLSPIACSVEAGVSGGRFDRWRVARLCCRA
jgi:hypothetical protein